MSLALLVETAVESGKYQTLIVPTKNDVLTFSRLSTGSRGRGSAWSLTTDTAFELAITSAPVAVVISDTDIALAEAGNVTALSTRLQSVAPQEPIAPNLEHGKVVSEIVEMLFDGDEALNVHLRDARRKTGVSLKPIKKLQNAFIPIAIAEPVAVPENAVTISPVTVSSAQFELATVPDKSWSERYIDRTIKGGKTVFEMLDIAKANKQNVLIRGHAGSGKTMSILAWSASRNYRYYNVSANVGLEPSHLFGMWTPTEHAGVFKWQDGAVTDLVRNGGVLLLNEIDFMPERITTVLFGLLDDRREIQLLEHGGEVIKAHPDLVIIGDHNPSYRGSRPMNQAWKDRFAHKWFFDYDITIEKKLIKSNALLEVAKKLRDQFDKGEIDTPISTRGLEYFCKNAENVNLDYAIDAYLNSFADDEREAIQLVFSTFRINLDSEFGIANNPVMQADEVGAN